MFETETKASCPNRGDVMKPAEVARLLHCNLGTVWRLFAEGHLEGFRLGNGRAGVCILRPSVEALMWSRAWRDRQRCVEELVVRLIHCHPDCPHSGGPHPCVVPCPCGDACAGYGAVCGCCLDAGRVWSCRLCADDDDELPAAPTPPPPAVEPDDAGANPVRRRGRLD
jgi:hypothetical protein